LIIHNTTIKLGKMRSFNIKEMYFVVFSYVATQGEGIVNLIYSSIYLFQSAQSLLMCLFLSPKAETKYISIPNPPYWEDQQVGCQSTQVHDMCMYHGLEHSHRI
jgi:hypothetical protein